jgi:hypothetical protein
MVGVFGAAVAVARRAVALVVVAGSWGRRRWSWLGRGGGARWWWVRRAGMAVGASAIVGPVPERAAWLQSRARRAAKRGVTLRAIMQNLAFPRPTADRGRLMHMHAPHADPVKVKSAGAK